MFNIILIYHNGLEVQRYHRMNIEHARVVAEDMFKTDIFKKVWIQNDKTREIVHEFPGTVLL